MKPLESIWDQVSEDYYEEGIKKNFFQKIWHGRKWAILKKMLEADARSILDVGCASGHLTAKVKRLLPNSKVIGLDVSKKFIRYARKNYKGIEFVLADAHNLPFKKTSFDLIIATESLEHFVSPNKVLKEIRRCIKKRGRIIIEMDSGSTLFRSIWLLWILLGPGRVWKGSHLTRFNSTKLERLIKEEGFLIIEKRYALFGMVVFFKAKKITNAENIRSE